MAVIEPEGAGTATNTHGDQRDLSSELNQGSSGEYNIIVTARQRGTLPNALWNNSYAVFVGENTHDKPVSRS